jgi:hypothetical protein
MAQDYDPAVNQADFDILQPDPRKDGGRTWL